MVVSAIVGIIGIIGSLYYVFNFPSPGFAGYFDKPSFVLLMIMPPSVMLLSHSIQDFITGISTLVTTLFSSRDSTQNEVIDILTRSSAMVRSDGIGALVQVRGAIRYPLLRDGVSLIINDFSPQEIHHNISNKINTKQTKMALASNLFENMSKLSPGVGMIGTLLGLIAMMEQLGDPSQIGKGMALAMITTLYGLLLGTLVYAPMGEKIGLEAEKVMETDQLVLEGVMSLKGKKSSVHMKDIMSTYAGKKSPKK